MEFPPSGTVSYHTQTDTHSRWTDTQTHTHTARQNKHTRCSWFTRFYLEMCIKHISAVLQRYTMLTRHGSPVTESDRRRNTFHKFIWMSREKLLCGLVFFFVQSAVSLEHCCTLSLCHLCHNPNIYTLQRSPSGLLCHNIHSDSTVLWLPLQRSLAL